LFYEKDTSQARRFDIKNGIHGFLFFDHFRVGNKNILLLSGQLQNVKLLTPR